MLIYISNRNYVILKVGDVNNEKGLIEISIGLEKIEKVLLF